MLNTQGTIKFSDHAVLYDILIPRDHVFRRFLSLVDFSFVYDELKDKYCPDNGRTAYDPVMMFKYLVLKAVSGLSDEKLVERCRYDMSYKFFLGLMPEDRVIEASTLSRFRRQRLADGDLLDLLLGKTVEVAKEHGVIDGKTIIVDSTHTISRCSPANQVLTLQKAAKSLRRMVYGIDEGLKASMPEKYEGTDLRRELDYIKKLASFVDSIPRLSAREEISQASSLMREMAGDIEDHYTISKDRDARTGHKSADSSFFGYKTHIAMTDERIVTAAVVTSGEKGDGPQLAALVDKTRMHLPEIERVIGDAAYAGQPNMEKAEAENFKIVAKVNPRLLEGTEYEKQGFTYNKDAERLVCPAGHMSKAGKPEKSSKSGNDRVRFRFSGTACNACAMRGSCIDGTARDAKSVRFPVKTELQLKQIEFMESQEFKEWYRHRYKIEAKNSELKHSYGYGKAIYYGVRGMEVQGAVALFASNLQRIVRLMDKNRKKTAA